MANCLFLKPIKGAGGDLPSIMGFVSDAEEVDHYELGTVDLGRYRALLLPSHLDQRYFGGITPVITRFLDGGGTLVFNGHVAWPMLPEFRPFEPLPKLDLENLQIHRLIDHPVFEGVEVDDLTFRRGVAGFYARGHNPPPEGAVAINGVGPQRLPCDWVYERPAGGRILMHAGNDLWMYAGATDTSAARIPWQLCAWAAAKERVAA